MNTRNMNLSPKSKFLMSMAASKERETEKTVVIRHPFPVAELHYVVIPKKDIKDAADVTGNDKEYLADAYAVMSAIIREKNLWKYKIITNGPGFQTMNYLHFHLIADLE